MTAPVYLSINEFPGDGVTTQFEFNFDGGYISRDHVKAYTTDATGVITPVIITAGMWVNDYTLNLGVSAPVGGKVRIYRETPRSAPLVNFEDGARITEANLDLLARQTVLSVAEAFDAGAYATVNDLLGAAGLALEAAQEAQAQAGLSEDAAAASAIAASAARIAAELAQAAAETAAEDPRVQTVYDNIAAIQDAAANAASAAASAASASASETAAANSASAADASADAAAASAAAAATFDPALFVPRAGDVTMTGPLSVPAGASGAQVPQAQEVGALANRQMGMVGQVAFFAKNSAPTGWLKANGAAVSRTTYAELFAAIGTTFGAGDGSTTFNLPDFRGEFPRGWDDGRGVDSARAFGSSQLSQNLSHTHSGTALGGGAHSHTTSASYRTQSGSVGYGGTGGTMGLQNGVNGVGDHTHALSINAEGGTEARPRNIALLVCIRF